MNKIDLVLDTSSLMQHSNKLEENIDNYNYYVSYIVASELDNLKESRNPNKSFKARKGLRFIEKYENDINFIVNDSVSENLPKNFDTSINDNKIISVALEKNCAIATNDRGMKIKCEALGIEIIDFNNQDEKYKGYKEILMTNEEMAGFYQRPVNIYNLKNNEYLIIKDIHGNVKDCYKNINDELIRCFPSELKSKMFGNIKGYDVYQRCLIDSLLHDKMTMVKGKAGSGKSLLSLAYAMDMLEHNEYGKLIIFANPICSRNSAKLGFYPGTRDEKILDSFVGSMLSSKFGDKEGVMRLIENGQLVLLPFSDMRGFDTQGMNAIVYILEAQNLNVDLMKLAIQRVSDDSKLIIDGDYTSQVDMSAYEGDSNGMRRVSQVFRGQDFYSEVELVNIYRSKMAKIADLM